MTDPENVANQIIVGFVASLFLFPVQKLFPFLFMKINTFRSFTLIRMEKLKDEALKRKKMKKKMEKRLRKGQSRFSVKGVYAFACSCIA